MKNFPSFAEGSGRRFFPFKRAFFLGSLSLLIFLVGGGAAGAGAGDVTYYYYNMLLPFSFLRTSLYVYSHTHGGRVGLFGGALEKLMGKGVDVAKFPLF